MVAINADVEPRTGAWSGRKALAGGRRLASPQRVVLLATLLVLIWQVAFPVAILLWTSFKGVRVTNPDFFDLSFTLKNFEKAISGGRLLSVTGTTVKFAGGSMVVALVCGTFLAWVTARTDAPLRALIGLLTLVQMAVPGILIPVAWTFIAGPEIGVLNVWWRSLTGGEAGLFDIYSMAGMIFVNGLAMVPMVYLFAVTVFASMNSSLEEAAQVSGASTWRSMRDISLPLAAPGIAAVAIMALMRAWEAFEVPWLLGLRKRIFTYASEIYLRTSTPPSDVGLISTYAVFMLVGAAVLIWWYDRFNRQGEKYAVISGKNYSASKLTLGPWRWPVTLLAMLVIAVSIIVPLLMLIWMSLQSYYQPPSLAALKTLSFDAYVEAFQAPNVVQGFLNSALIGAATAVAVLVLSLLAAWYSARKLPGGRALYLLTSAPMALPNVIVGVSFLWLFLIIPVPVYGTHWAIVIAYVTVIIAVVARLVSARMLQISRELEEAAQVSGASFLRALWTIVVPLLSPALVAGALITVVMSFRELQTTLYLAGPNTRTAAVVMFDMAGDGRFSTVAALGITTFLILLAGIFGYQRLTTRMGVEGNGV